MTQIDPFVRCSDYWPGKIPPVMLAEYKKLLSEKQITKPHVIYNQQAGTTLVIYQANQPHEWIKERFRKVLYSGD